MRNFRAKKGSSLIGKITGFGRGGKMEASKENI